MATIALYANKIKQMPGLLNDVKQSVTDYKSELSVLKKKTLTINKSVCDLDDIISSINTSSQTQEKKITSLNTFNQKSKDFITDVARIDSDVADVVKKRKDDFYDKYNYLKPEYEKTNWDKFKDGCKSVGEWCKDHWKAIVTVIIVIAAIVVIVFFPAAAPILLLAAKGAILGAVSGGLIGGLTSLAAGGSFWEGFENGAFSGALTGALFGGLGGAGQILGNALGTSCKVFSVLNCISKISGGIALGMGGFDLLAMGIGIFDPTNSLVIFNQNLHSNKLYNAFQFSVSALAVFSAGAYKGMKMNNPACFVAGTMILTATGLIAIENIKKGDKVISTNAETFEAELKTVLETYIREVPQLVHLVVDGELITTTIDHPFYVKNHGFINAGKLRVGNEVINSKGDIYLVECIDIELVGKSVTVYNFQVEDYHTYHVGNIGILVHNANYPKTPGQYEKASYHNKGNNVKSAAPAKGQESLNKSVPIKSTTTRRVSVDGNNFVVFDETSAGVFHGHIRTWAELTQTMKNALVNAGLANQRGKIL